VKRGPPEPPELADRILSDAWDGVHFDTGPLVARVVERLRVSDHWHPLIAAEEIATEEVAGLWDEENLADAYGRALADVHEQYLAHALRVLEAIDELEADGREAWAARGISHRVAFGAAWQALDDLDLLDSLPAEALCAACGAELEREESESV
jgi:hypothetical protein